MDDEKSFKFTVKIPRRQSQDKRDEEESIRDRKEARSTNKNEDKRDKIDDKRDKNDDKRNRHKDSHRDTHKEMAKDELTTDERKRWKVKFEQIQTQLSRTEIQMYDYKLKLNDLMKENLNLREHLQLKIKVLEESLNNKNSDYSNLINKYNELKLKMTDQSTKLNAKLNERNESSELIDFNDCKINLESNQNNNQISNNELLDLMETNRKLVHLNEQFQQEIKNLETELEESSDRYREDQTNEFRELKFKLENSVKNCRLLQFKLTKLERAYNQVKVENHHLSNKLKKATELSNLRNRPATPQTEITKTELDKAKEVLLRMHISLQTVKGEKMRLEEQLNLTKSELLALSLKHQNQMKTNRALSPQSSIDKQLEETIRDLEERESDLQEQLKFSEQQSDSLRKQLSAIEQENEILTKQLQALCNSNKNDANSIENIVVLKVEQDEQLNQLKKELEEQKKQNSDLETKLETYKNMMDNKEFIKRRSGELIRKGSGEIVRRDSGGSEMLKKDSLELRRHSEDTIRDTIENEFKSDKLSKNDESFNQLSKSISNTSLNAFSKVEKVLQKENQKFGSLFYEEKIENLERQLIKLKGDLNEKQQENENLMNLIELKRKDGKFGKRLIRSSSLQES